MTLVWLLSEQYVGRRMWMNYCITFYMRFMGGKCDKIEFLMVIGLLIYFHFFGVATCRISWRFERKCCNKIRNNWIWQKNNIVSDLSSHTKSLPKRSSYPTLKIDPKVQIYWGSKQSIVSITGNDRILATSMLPSPTSAISLI